MSLQSCWISSPILWTRSRDIRYHHNSRRMMPSTRVKHAVIGLVGIQVWPICRLMAEAIHQLLGMRDSMKQRNSKKQMTRSAQHAPRSGSSMKSLYRLYGYQAKTTEIAYHYITRNSREQQPTRRDIRKQNQDAPREKFRTKQISNLS